MPTHLWLPGCEGVHQGKRDVRKPKILMSYHCGILTCDVQIVSE